MTAPPARRRLALTDDGIIDPVAVEIAARGIRAVALTRAERQLAAVRILARGGTPYLIAKRLHVSGTTALTLAARCQGVNLMPWPDRVQRAAAKASAVAVHSARPGTGKRELRAG